MSPSAPDMLAINGGSSRIKFALFEAGGSLRRSLEGALERIGLPDGTLRVKGLNQADNFARLVTTPDHTVAVGVLTDRIEDRVGRDALAAVGHRVAHGGLDTLVFAGGIDVVVLAVADVPVVPHIGDEDAPGAPPGPARICSAQ